MVRLAIGDVIYIKAHDGHDADLFGATDEILCTFSGYMVKG